MLIGLGLEEFAALAAKALTPKPVLELSLAHIHAPTVSVKEQGAIVVDRLRRQKTMTFRALTRDSPDTLTTVARFLSLLELFREGAVSFDQMSPLGELTVRWTGAEDGEVEITDEFDGTPSEVVADVSAGTTDDDGETVVVLADADQDADPADENHPDENEEKENP